MYYVRRQSPHHTPRNPPEGVGAGGVLVVSIMTDPVADMKEVGGTEEEAGTAQGLKN